jgi:Tfp pilus assembly protein PilF
MNDDQLLIARKKCGECGENTELLRFRCPRCGSEVFDFVPTGADPELVSAMYARQKRSQQHVDRGGRLFQQGMHDEAFQEFQKAVEANPWNATAHGNIGVIFLRRGEPETALHWFKQAIEIDPNVPGGKAMLQKAQHQVQPD